VDAAFCGKQKLQQATRATINLKFQHRADPGAGQAPRKHRIYFHSRRVERFFSDEMRTSGDFMRNEKPKPVQSATALPSATRSGYVEGSLSQFFLKVCSFDFVRNVVEVEVDCQRRTTPEGLREDRNKRRRSQTAGRPSGIKLTGGSQPTDRARLVEGAKRSLLCSQPHEYHSR
jgi:hypothetical protein